VSWLSSFFIGVLTALLAGTAGGFLAAKCVDWYNISSREGASGYFVISIVLLSAFIGFFAGLIISRYFTGFLTGFGAASGSILSLAGVIALFAWGLADIPPTIAGHDLNLVIEARLPKGSQKPPVLEGKQFVWFESGPRFGPSRASRYGPLDTANARFEDGRWVVPGSVYIFTTRNSRRVAIALDDKTAAGFEVTFPGHPGPKYKQWRQWLPNAEIPNWPDSNMSYRFRIEEVIPVATPPVADPFKALTSESPLREWLRYFDGFGRQPETYQAIMKQVEARPADLAEVLRSSNEEDYHQALNAVYSLSSYDPQVVQAMRDVAADFAQEIRKFNSMAPQEPGAEELGAHIRDRFSHWCNTWGPMQNKIHADGRTPVEEILQLASVRAESPTMQAVAESARYLLAYLKQ
jgi:hypothetical protein